MSLKQIPTPDANWSLILKAQDEYSHQEDLRHKQQSRIRQRLYKQQLEQLISEQRTKLQGDKLEEKRVLSYATQKINAITVKENEERQKWQRMRENFSLDNYCSSLEKKKTQTLQNQEQKKRFSQRFKKISTEVSQQKQHEKRSHSLKQHQLALAYDQQLAEENRKKLLSRDEEIQFQALAKRIEDEKERERQRKLNRIRFGYGQNPHIFNVFQQAEMKQQMQRNKFINELANSHKNYFAPISEQQSLLQKSDLRKQVSTYNREQFEQKTFKKKLTLIEQTLQQKEKLTHISEMLEEEKRQKSLQKERQRKELQSELQRQIRDFQKNKTSTMYMNPEEFKINSSLIKKNRIQGGTGFLPGVKYDHQLQKQQKLIERFLGGGNGRN